MKTDAEPTLWSVVDRLFVNDPAEDWELPYTKREGARYFDGITSYPVTPKRREDVPVGALEQLEDACGIEELGQILVIPWAVRSVDLGERRIITPTSVLALGARGVGLWTDKPVPGIKSRISLEDLAAIEDVTILLYGRLSFLSRGGRVTIRYNTVAREKLEPALLGLRKRLAGSMQPIPRQAEGSAPLPFKWENIVRSNLARLQEDAAVAFRFARAPRRSRRDPEQAFLLVLNPRELVYIKDPLGSPYGSDSFIVPRSSISDTRILKKHLDITVNRARFQLAMMPELLEAAAQWLLSGRNN